MDAHPSQQFGTATWQAANLQLLLGYLRRHPCVDCGEADPVVLDLAPRDRRMAVSALMWRASWAAIEAEVASCEVRCTSCRLATSRN